jgi:hypothetical protein
MSGTRRTPLARQPAVQITPRAVELFVAMGKLRCTCPSPKPVTPCLACEKWHVLHGELHTALALKPWQWPAVCRREPKAAGSPTWNEDIAARMALLDEAVRRATP